MERKDWLPAKKMAEACSLDYRAFQKLEVEPVKRGAKGQAHYYAFADVMRAWHVYQSKKFISEKEDGPRLDLKRELARKTAADADGKEIKNDIARGEYVRIEHAENSLGVIASAVDGVLSSIPLNIKRRLPELSASALRIVETEIVNAQNKLADIRLDIED